MEDKNKNIKSKIAEREEEILKFWQDNKIFEKTLAKKTPEGEFVFYDGPPFATGTPHYGHILPGTIKDVIPRYQTMRGKRVERHWGWDCHGLPVENLVEKELGLSSKKNIEEYGVEKFNKAAKESVMRYADEWGRIVPRLGRWVDMENDYKTMDTSYTESIWWAFKELYDKGLVYKSFKSMHLCPHCETTLSNFEVNQGYKDIADISIFVKFKSLDEDKTYFLAWTTTPWTLPGNVALAVNKDTDYAKVEKNGEFLIIAWSLLRKVLKGEVKIIEKFKGKKLVGKKYEPLFSYYDNKSLENRGNGFKIYHGDFVTTEDGTGIVHIAPAFGEEDMKLGQKENLPFIQHVNVDGTFKKEVADFAGQLVKPKEDHQKADVEIIKFLAKKGRVLDKERLIHSYPHCWRCYTPLLNYATTSWFVKTTDLKKKLIKINSEVNWYPKEIGEGRFGKWLEEIRDWAISRSRYWGAPLPVWQNGKGEVIVIGSIGDLKKHVKKSGNKYFLMRHGECMANLEGKISADISIRDPLTEEGEKQVMKAAKNLKKEKIDLIITSPFLRAKKTAEIIAKEIGFGGEIIEDERIEELRIKEWNGRKWSEYQEQFTDKERFEKHVGKAENWEDVRKRVSEFMFDIDSRYKNKNILIISHGGPLVLSMYASKGLSVKEMANQKHEGIFENAEVKEIDWWSFPHNDDFEIDLHRPFIDQVELVLKNGEELKRIEEVFDCWFESGSMPYAQFHYPFENEKEFEKKNFPADFIAEGLDQTRGWFYTLLILGIGLFGKSPYKNVIVNGLILAEDGRKMSKSLKNYPEISYIVDKYGADALRYYLMSSSAVKAEDLNFSEKGVDEVSKKVILKLGNVLSFYEMYVDKNLIDCEYKGNSENILDRWILSKLNELQKVMTESLDDYRIDGAARPVLDFIEDFSTWYIRRSRDRFKSEDREDKVYALNTTCFVLLELSKYMAPFTPFMAENIYLKLRKENNPQSVHLSQWPKAGKIDEEILANMSEVRRIVSLALEKRMAAGIKIRQPLKELRAKSLELENKEEYLELIKDEINVKKIIFDENLKEDVELNTELTPELIQEGNIREFIRAVQSLRKEKNLVPEDKIELLVETDNKGKEFLDSVAKEMRKPTNVSEIKFESNDGEKLKVGDLDFMISIIHNS
ncbi:MAG: class I tRNA ligase family protein [Candidatus Zambryskibacteria bacterium]|nr:class I tRNA ligase family protein [Candidatus Zambryskibacteria bacterium]